MCRIVDVHGPWAMLVVANFTCEENECKQRRVLISVNASASGPDCWYMNLIKPLQFDSILQRPCLSSWVALHHHALVDRDVSLQSD